MKSLSYLYILHLRFIEKNILLFSFLLALDVMYKMIETYYHNCKSMKNKRDFKGFDIFSTCKSSPSDICEKQEVTSEHAPLQIYSPE